MLVELWVLECRFRGRKNGKWSEWEAVELKSRGYVTAFTSYPAAEVVREEHYERRAVLFTRAEGATT